MQRLASLKPEAIVLGGDDITVDATSQYIQPSTVPPRVKTAVFYGDSDNAPEETKYDFVFTGYRYHYSTWEGLTGLFQLHYETVNIWTHLLGLVWYLAQFPHLREVLDAHGALPVDRLYYYGFLAAAVFQMATSTAYHMWRNMSQGAETALLRLDVLGVTAMIVGSYAVGLLNGFWCDPWLHGAWGGGKGKGARREGKGGNRCGAGRARGACKQPRPRTRVPSQPPHHSSASLPSSLLHPLPCAPSHHPYPASPLPPSLQSSTWA